MKKVILTILDGFGINENETGNAILNAHIPAIKKLLKEFPNSTLFASGNYVGLPEGQMGNSEVGHITIGSGRIIDQPLLKINKALEDTSFYKNEVLLSAINHAKKNNSKLHIFGLLSDGGVHSHINHIFSLIKMAKENNIEKLYIHAITDGRDVPYNSAVLYLDSLQDLLNKLGIGKIATVAGRYYAMDREKIWERTKKEYDALVFKEANVIKSYKSILKESYSKEVFDEFIEPTIIEEEGLIEENDSIIIANFRPDRLPQIIKAFTDKEFNSFKTKKFENLKLVTMMPVGQNINAEYAFSHDSVKNTLTEVLAKENYRVLRIAETTKFPHVTHFIDGDRDIELKNTTKILVPRKEVATYDLIPEMSANEVTEKIKYLIDDYDFVIVNYANGDMVGHTGNYKAAIKAVEAIDKALESLYEISFQKDIILIITADHGNCEEMIRKDGKMHTYHTTNKVPFIVCDKKYKVKDGKLSDIAPSILRMLHINIPDEMTGNIIIENTK